ncbi:MAG: hypothetical protein O2958_02865 [Gemmatimonadetes bacterium]|nr:hypothetical protein [Gemmatimonadota bacterium]MDA1102258.1 hypothetical protein [Gemmatimonadota bacterium]
MNTVARPTKFLLCGSFLAAAVLTTATEVAAQAATEVPPAAPALRWDPNDPRIGLGAGWLDAESAISGMQLLAAIPRPDGFFNPSTPADGRFSNTDLAFRDEMLIQGNYNGFQIYDISNPADPSLALSVVCPGGQGDVSVYGNLVVMSAQETRGRLDCGLEGVADSISSERMRGVRIFDISNLNNPTQVAAIQSCRGSHTHTLVTDPNDSANLYIYIQGTSSVRPGEELPGCSGGEPEDDADTSLFRIEVVRVPLAAPQRAEIVNMPRIFADEATGNIAGLWQGGDHGPGTQSSRRTNQCHDITAFPGIGLAGGACSGNGILLDISDPVNPRRIGEVADPNFAYWHSATFNNSGSTIVFTDEWGGGSAPRCRASDPATWGANAIFTIEDGEMELAGYYKLPVPQTETENCVAHNGSIIPVPGRDLMVQAWYQGGLSIMDFTDPANAFEIAFFDRGPLSIESLFTGGYWSTYWFNGRIYGAEISRGIDVFRLTPSEHLSQAEIDAAEAVHVDEFNAQLQPQVTWAPSVSVAQAYLDQMVRGNRILNARAAQVTEVLQAARRGSATAAQLGTVARQLDADVAAINAGTLGGDADRMAKLSGVLRGLGS